MVLQTREWPGNARELRNAVERALILSTGEAGEEISVQYVLPEAVSPGSVPGFSQESLLALPLREARDLFERDYIAAQLSRFGGRISRTAQFIGMERSALHRKIKLLALATRDTEDDLA